MRGYFSRGPCPRQVPRGVEPASHEFGGHYLLQRSNDGPMAESISAAARGAPWRTGCRWGPRIAGHPPASSAAAHKLVRLNHALGSERKIQQRQWFLPPDAGWPGVSAAAGKEIKPAAAHPAGQGSCLTQESRLPPSGRIQHKLCINNSPNRALPVGQSNRSEVKQQPRKLPPYRQVEKLLKAVLRAGWGGKERTIETKITNLFKGLGFDPQQALAIQGGRGGYPCHRPEHDRRGQDTCGSGGGGKPA